MEDAKNEAELTGIWQPFYKAQKLTQLAASKRAEILYKAPSLINLGKKLVQEILIENKSNKVAVFTSRTEIADLISSHAYHAKKSDVQNKNTFTKFNSGEIRELVLVDKINRGVNINGLNNLIFLHFNSSDTKIKTKTWQSIEIKCS